MSFSPEVQQETTIHAFCFAKFNNSNMSLIILQEASYKSDIWN